jgi:hypothetical protein
MPMAGTVPLASRVGTPPARDHRSELKDCGHANMRQGPVRALEMEGSKKRRCMEAEPCGRSSAHDDQKCHAGKENRDAAEDKARYRDAQPGRNKLHTSQVSSQPLTHGRARLHSSS